MGTLRRIILEEAVLAAGFLIAAWYAFYLAAIWGLMEYFREGPMKDYFTGPGIHVEMILSGVFFGAVVAVVNRLTEAPRFRSKPMGQLILLKTGIYLTGLVLSVVGVHAFLLAFVYTPRELSELVEFMSLRLTVGLFSWIGVTVLAANFLLEVRRKVGPGRLWALLTGKYHRPRDEERVFLFLDLRSSTTIAEELGHNRYSQLLRECFHDLTEFILKSGAEIYQFVGDEVVLTWPMARNGAEKESLKVFFAFQSRLRQRRGCYETRFGVVPEFRGGVESGVVTATEVGDIKREIAFHGDPLNVASRLLGLSRDRKQPVLVSDRIRKAIASDATLTITPEGEIILRGKTLPVSVFAVRETVSTLA